MNSLCQLYKVMTTPIKPSPNKSSQAICLHAMNNLIACLDGSNVLVLVCGVTVINHNKNTRLLTSKSQHKLHPIVILLHKRPF